VTPFGEASFFRRKRGVTAGTGAGRGTSTQPVLFAACKSNQSSSDATFAGRGNGAFTYFLLKELKKKSSASRADLLKAIRADLKAGRYDQVPQLEGPAAAKKAKIGT
jgi:hypothetical protein